MSAPVQLEVVLITGANQGLGYFAALQLSKLPGYHVLVGSRDAKKGIDAVNKIRAEGPVSAVSPIVIDVDSDESIESARAEVERRFGQLDVLVNNAGINLEFVEGHPPDLSTREVFARTYNTNVFGLAVATEEFVPLLEKAAFPRIVNLSSPLASLTNMSNPAVPYSVFRQLAYNGTKTAINALTVHFAGELKARLPNIRVIALDPGYNATAMTANRGTQSPEIGAAGIVRAVTEKEDGEFKNGEYRDQFGAIVPW